jgi:SAM-dependent methyltransferase
MKLKNCLICIDFDGTIVEHAFPRIGEPLPGAMETMRQLMDAGAKLILNTCREDEGKKKFLTEAVNFCKKHGVEFVSVNENRLEDDFRDNPDSLRRKPYAHVYIDDRNFGGFPGWDVIGKVLLGDYVYSGTINDAESQKRWKEIEEMAGAGETRKAYGHRLRDGWFEKYAPEDQPGIDIGCQHDPLNQTFRRYDLIFGDGDAQHMFGVPDESFQTVYASHVLEHIRNPAEALQNWYRILKPGGHLIFMVPHRDRYEKKKELPSYWNHDHKWFFMPSESEAPNTIGVLPLLMKALPESLLVSLTVLEEGWEETPSDHHAVGEFSIEAIVRKPLHQIDEKDLKIIPMSR